MYPPEKLVLPDNIGITAEGEPPLRRKGVPAQLAEQVPKEEWRQVWSAHLALTTMADDVLGMILEELKNRGNMKIPVWYLRQTMEIVLDSTRCIRRWKCMRSQ